MAFSGPGRIKEGRTRGKEPSRGRASRCSRGGPPDEDSQINESNSKDTDDQYFGGASNFKTFRAGFHANSTQAISNRPGLEIGQNSPDRIAGRSRTLRGRCGAFGRGEGRGNTTYSSKGQSINPRALQAIQFIGKYLLFRLDY